jgi:uncharacterized protein
MPLSALLHYPFCFALSTSPYGKLCHSRTISLSSVPVRLTSLTAEPFVTITVLVIGNHRKVNRMAISQELLEILACPACKAKVELKPDGSGLKCVECKRVYPIRDDIPVMLVDEAKIEQ